MSLQPFLANSLWLTASLGAWRRYRAALGDPAREQDRLLRRYLRDNTDTVVGRRYGFARIRSVAEFQARVPLTTYDEIEPFVRRIARGETHVLTTAPVHRLATSSGSTAAAKLVPYTRLLQREIARAVGAWIADLYRSCPGLMSGHAYWSITPPAGPARPFYKDCIETTASLETRSTRGARRSNSKSDDASQNEPPSAVPIGFDEDSAYLGRARRAMLRAVLAVPPDIRLNGDLDAFRRATLVCLLRARDLRLISVWHPSFLSALLDTMIGEWGRLVDRVAGHDQARARALRRVSPDDLGSIWPKLQLISCWGDGPAHAAAAALAGRAAAVTLQPKGLIATEGVVTIPFRGRHPIAVCSHFFEFIAPDGQARLAHELASGVEYTVVLTTGGGLYRYHLADRVVMDGCVGETPSLRFVGKDDRVSDRFGEKLSDGFVAKVIDALFASGPRPRFAMLAPEESASGVAYTLFVAMEAPVPALAAALEVELRRNPHYAWCVDLGQLRPARVVRVAAGADRAYVNVCVERGQRLGDVKPVALHTATGWAEVLPC